MGANKQHSTILAWRSFGLLTQFSMGDDARRPNRAEVALKKMRALTPEERRIRAREAARAYANLLFGRPRRRLRKISRDSD